MYRRFLFIAAFAPALFLFVFSTNCHAQNMVDKQQLTGHINYRNNPGFMRVPHIYADKTVYLRKETFQAYKRMYLDALKVGVHLNIISGTRSFHDQVCKWQSKWAKVRSRRLDQRDRVLEVLKWSSMPGTSRHHWGTDVDLANVEPRFFNTRYGKKVYGWLTQNAAKYGFYQPFTANRNGGYMEEKWHWSYAPQAKPFLEQYSKYITENDITGFPGSQYAGNINVIKYWVLQVNPQCL